MTRILAVLAALSVAAAGSFAAAQDRTFTTLPVGDGRVSDRAEAGHVYACQTQFRNGAEHGGPWIDGDTWNPMAKPRVEGEVYWPEARFDLDAEGDALAVEGNGLPVGQPTGEFPISPDQLAYRYDRNPNRITAQDLDFEIPARPQRAAEPLCLPMGMIGFTLTGVAFYNALDDAGRDAAAHEVQDLCDGHPQARGQYHYHSASACLPGAPANAVVGWALDGYPIMGMVDADGRLLGNADLDDCHGRAETVEVDGRVYDYAYRLTPEYPYVLGCYVGRVPDATRRAVRDGMGPPQNDRRQQRREGRPPPRGG